jgi:CubicO group peptidase (beta-lactamase class C family)
MNRRSFVQTAAASLLAPSLPIRDLPAKNELGIRPPTSEFLATLPRLMELSALPGLGIGVVHSGQPPWLYYAGVANVTTKTPITADSLFPAASLGKQPFAFAVLHLAEQGKIDLDRPVNQYLTDDPITGPDGDRVTARHILSHSSGLPNWRRNAKDPLLPAFSPGAKFRYSGEGYYHLERVVETITGIGFESFMQTAVFTPLKMTSSTYLWSTTAKDHYVSGHYNDEPTKNTDFATTLYSLIESSNRPLSDWNHPRIVEAIMKKLNNPVAPAPNDIVPNAASSLLTTTSDYCLFLATLLGSHTANNLSPAMQTTMETPVVRINSALSWGLGIGIEQVDDQTYLWQWGNNGAWRNILLAHPRTQSAIVVFTNGGNGEHIYQRIVQAASGVDNPAFLWI